LIIVSQSKAPFPFVKDNGVAYMQTYTLNKVKNTFKTIRVCKSASSFKDDAYLKANYALLVEVY
jgi:hypothetical protein